MSEVATAVATSKDTKSVSLTFGEDGFSIWSDLVSVHFDAAGSVHLFVVYAPWIGVRDVFVWYFESLGVDVHCVWVAFSLVSSVVCVSLLVSSSAIEGDLISFV